jgi:hypothetical protein
MALLGAMVEISAATWPDSVDSVNPRRSRVKY